MYVNDLAPRPIEWLPFSKGQIRRAPQNSGCYAITTFDNHLLYIGMAINIKRRLVQHLDDPDKATITPYGRATKVFWRMADDIRKLERTWLNSCAATDGALPPFNIIDSPAS